MKCPIFVASLLKSANHDSVSKKDCDCLKKDCAWFIEGVEQCSVARLMISFSIAAEIMTMSSAEEDGIFDGGNEEFEDYS